MHWMPKSNTTTEVMALERIAAQARRFPCKLLVVTVLLLLGAGEWYPLSNYPMFASIDPVSWYVYVTDANDRPLAIQPHFGVSAGVLRRMYRTHCEARRGASEGGAPGMLDAAAGQAVLEFLLRSRRPAEASRSPSRIRLWHAAVSQADGRIVRHAELVAEVGVP